MSVVAEPSCLPSLRPEHSGQYTQKRCPLVHGDQPTGLVETELINATLCLSVCPGLSLLHTLTLSRAQSFFLSLYTVYEAVGTEREGVPFMSPDLMHYGRKGSELIRSTETGREFSFPQRIYVHVISNQNAQAQLIFF